MIAPVLGTLNALLRQFPEEVYYVSRDAALQAYGSEGLFNVIDFTSGWKVDFIIRKSRPFSVAEDRPRRCCRRRFERRREVALLGRNLLSVASVEDVVISKLEWSSSQARNDN